MTTTPLTRDEARAIEEALIRRHPGFQNRRHEISPNHSWYDDAVAWGGLAERGTAIRRLERAELRVLRASQDLAAVSRLRRRAAVKHTGHTITAPDSSGEFRLPSGRQVDGINFQTREVVELKPNNPRARRGGERQLTAYLEEHNREFPGTPWTGRVETYDP